MNRKDIGILHLLHEKNILSWNGNASFKIGLVVILFCLINVEQGLSQVIRPEAHLITIHLRGVYNSKVTLTPYANGRYQAPLVVVPDVTGEVKLNVPATNLPGQFLLRMDYRKKAEEQPYPAEFVFYMSDHDLRLGINPLAVRPDSIDFGTDNENPAYFKFIQANEIHRQQLALLEQLLTGYDTRDGKFYKMTEEEFEKRRQQYNGWISSQKDKYKGLFISSLFDFQKINPVIRNISGSQQLKEQTLHFFDQVNLQDTLMLRTQGLSDFMNAYMGLFGTQATTEKLRDSLFTEAGRIACEKASAGHPKVYGWMVDYFFRGYESYNITAGTAMLQKFIDDPRCLTPKKQEILRRLEGMEKMKVGSSAPGFEAEMFDGMKLRFDEVSKQKKYEMIVFYESDCGHCKELLKDLSDWYRVPENKVWFDIITVAMDDDRKTWEQNYQLNKFEWHDVWAPGGVNSQVAKDYYVLSTPVVYIIDKQMKVSALPQNIEEIKQFLNNK
jgi:thioredoxin-related protein